MIQRNRRQFLADVGRGMLIAGVGPALAADLGLARVMADEPAKRLDFGKLEPLVALMQDTPADKLLPILVERLGKGTDLQQLMAAGALANARTFGGEDYIGFHTMMAMGPAFRMAQQLPVGRRALPVLKVLHRNTRQIQVKGGSKSEVLRPVEGVAVPAGKVSGEVLFDAVMAKDMSAAEATFAGVAAKSAEDAYNDLLLAVQDRQDVHRIVMAYRAWDLLDVVGKERAHTMLRQSVHYCVKREVDRKTTTVPKSRALLVKLFDQYKLAGKTPGKTPGDNAWVERLSQTIFEGPPEQAAEAAAAALAEGFSPEAIGEALSLATNELVLRDNGRPNKGDNKPAGSVHGDSIGVHACDSANAWRNIARVSNARNAMASLILGAYQASGDRTDRSGDFLKWERYPRADARARVKGKSLENLIDELKGAVRDKDQALASAVTQRCSEFAGAHEQVFLALLDFNVSEDGALHAEKYYRTASEEFAVTRPAFRWRHPVALARVTASLYGYPAPGFAQACELLKA